LGFDVQVIVANNVEKTYQKSLLDRAESIKGMIDRVNVYSCDSDNIGIFIKSIDCKAIIRGVRDIKDFEYEQKVADYNREVNGLETIYIPCSPEMRDVSSTKIRATQNNA
jgi:pantetheine-phosphate adenylyltransferase